MRSTLQLLLATALAALLTGSASAGDALKTRPDADDRPARAARQAPAPPEALVLEVEIVEESAAVADVDDEIAREREARRAELVAYARAAALHRARKLGATEYYRTGAWRGLRDAMSDPALGDWDRRQGFREGRFETSARQDGRRIGRAAAEDEAGLRAEERVAEQFRQLLDEPRFNDREPWVEPAFAAEDWFAAPSLDDVFADLPFSMFADRRLARAFHGTRFSPARLNGCQRWDEVYLADWADSGVAWRQWAERRDHARWLRSLRFPENRAWAERAFRRHFERELSLLWESLLRQAWLDGYDDGFDYGAWVRYEHAFREGFARGVAEATATAARASFADRFAAAFRDAYRQSFDAWSNEPRIEVEAVVLNDADDDGVFSPGEGLTAEIWLVNFGGAEGSALTELDGPALERIVDGSARLASRSRAEQALSLDARVRADAPLRRDGVLDVRLGGRSTAVPLRVAWPLQFEGAARVGGLDPVAGVVDLELTVRNVSRRVRDARVILEGEGTLRQMSLAALPAGGASIARLSVDRIAGSRLLDGSLRFAWTLVGDGSEQDRRVQQLPDFAVDLGSPWLTDYLVALADDPGADADELARVQALAWQRMQADWRRAVKARGNPYKKDLKRRDANTELGDWVRLARGSRSANPVVWRELGRTIESRAGDLPGVHPLLRRWLKKLSKRLG